MEELLTMGTIPQWVTVGWSIGVGITVGAYVAHERFRAKHPKMTKDEKLKAKQDAIIAEGKKILESRTKEVPND